MRKMCAVLALAALLFAAACSEGPTSPARSDDSASHEVILTPGFPSPAPAQPSVGPQSNFAATSATLGGSIANPISLKPNTCASGSSQVITVTFSVSGNQAGTATFKVLTNWTYDGSAWSGSGETTVTVPQQSGGTTTFYPVGVTVMNNSGSNSGTSSFGITTFGVTNSNATGAKLDGSGTATLHVEFVDCPVANTAPTLTVPEDITAEATSSAGASVSFVVTASDAEDGDLSNAVVCTSNGSAVNSGDTFPLGTTIVSCSVMDAGGLESTGMFAIYVQDTTAPSFTAFPGNQTLIAANINGIALDLAAFGITAADFGDVSPPVSISCTVNGADADGYQIGIGMTRTVSCTATDDSAYPSPNTSAASTFDAFVTLDVAQIGGFLPPLRMAAPYSAHKRGSTIPHKFPPPLYADGTPATDLAAGLRLVLTFLGSSGESFGTPENDLSAGSTAWRYDPESGHYVFNAKSGSGWSMGDWETSVSFMGVPIARTYFKLNK